jgi:hypothetical protein
VRGEHERESANNIDSVGTGRKHNRSPTFLFLPSYYRLTSSHLSSRAPPPHLRYCNITTYDWTEPKVRALWIEVVTNATKNGIDGIFADHSANQGVHIGVTEARGVRPAQGANQLCNGAGKHSRCFNFTDTFRDSFNSWHLWATNYTQDLLSRTTGGPVIQGPLASMNNATSWGGNITDPDYCDFDGIREAQASSGMAVFEARGSCKITETCLAAYLAAAERGTYIHCVYSGDDLLTATAFPEVRREGWGACSCVLCHMISCGEEKRILPCMCACVCVCVCACVCVCVCVCGVFNSRIWQ